MAMDSLWTPAHLGRAMVIETSSLIRRAVTEVLESADFEPKIANSFAAAQVAINREPVDLICLAYHLPDIEGTRAVEQLRSNPLTSNTPIIMFTSVNDENAIRNAYEAGVTEVFAKTSFQQFRSYIEQHAEGRRERRQLSGHVLYVEDSKVTAGAMARVFSQLGLTHDHFLEAKSALRALESRGYDLVVTDVILEGTMSGIQLVRTIRASSENISDIPVLALSANDDPVRRVELFHSGVSDFIRKPLIIEEFTARVANLVTARRLLKVVAAQKDRLQELVNIDQLTGLSNRHHLMSEAPRLLAQANEDGQAVSVLVLDLDHFKTINDNHGHTAGDTVLADIAGALRTRCGHETLLARFGGEEFVLVLPDCSADAAESLASELRETISDLKPSGIDVTASCGIATLQRSGQLSFEELFDRADRALYEAKRDGRDRVRTFVVSTAA